MAKTRTAAVHSRSWWRWAQARVTLPALACAALMLLFAVPATAQESQPIADGPAMGHSGPIGCGPKARRVARLVITRPGVYENILVDGGFADDTLVKIEADNVVLRRCEIRNGTDNGIVVTGKNVRIEDTRIHHLLRGTFDDQKDAHGITGQAQGLVVRNCEIYQVSGDALQFDPGRRPWDDVVIERCTFWTGPLEADAAGFRRGERPGENALDTKALAKHPRSKVVIRDSVFYGFGDGQITNQAALNLKENVDVTVERCLFRGNDVCFRLRGGSGERGGARVTIRDCAVYESDVALRIEDKIEGLTVDRLAIGAGIKRKRQDAGGGPGPGFQYVGEVNAPAFEVLLRRGFPKRR